VSSANVDTDEYVFIPSDDDGVSVPVVIGPAAGMGDEGWDVLLCKPRWQ
jgi:hypothetical protein